MTASVLPDDLQVPEQLSRRKARKQLLFLTGVILAVVVVVTLLPGLEGLRTLSSAAWLVLPLSARPAAVAVGLVHGLATSTERGAGLSSPVEFEVALEQQRPALR
jgi:hypothetical protein